MQRERYEFYRSLALHRAVAERLRDDPTVLDRARAKLEDWLAQGGRSAALLLEWREILAGRPEEVIRFLIEETEHADWLRSASPFAGVLEPRAREAILRRSRQEHGPGP